MDIRKQQERLAFSAGQEVNLFRNGELVKSGCVAEHIHHPVVPVTWLANELSRTSVGMKAAG